MYDCVDFCDYHVYYLFYCIEMYIFFVSTELICKRDLGLSVTHGSLNKIKTWNTQRPLVLCYGGALWLSGNSTID